MGPLQLISLGLDVLGYFECNVRWIQTMPLPTISKYGALAN
jgi:hypothetical protein